MKVDGSAILILFLAIGGYDELKRTIAMVGQVTYAYCKGTGRVSG